LEQIPGLELIRLQGMKRAPGLLRDVRAYFKLKEIFRRIRPDVVHTHGAKPGLLGRLAAHSMRVPVILHTYHGHIFHSYFNRFISALVVRAERWLAKKSTAIIAISDHLRNELSEKYHIAPANKIYTIPLLLNLVVFQDSDGVKRTRFRSAYQLQKDEVAVGIIGRLTKVKNMQLFANVVEMLHQRAAVPYRFFIIGDGAEKKMLQQQFTQAHIEHTEFTERPVKATVTFTSWLRNTDEVMNGLDIVCLTSLNEGTPVSLIEAQAASKPVVTTSAGSIPDMIIENEGGFLTGISDANTFAQRVETLALDESLRRRMGQAGYKRINELYNMHHARELTRRSYQAVFLRENTHAKT
jgi:glycosyltransferase involved in cell wall biosynthesis